MSNLNHFQFSMFEQAGTLANPLKTQHGDRNAYPGYKALRTEKINDTLHTKRGASMHHRVDTPDGGILPDEQSNYGAIKEEGVQAPVELQAPGGDERLLFLHPSRPTLMNGHHRVFASAHIDPKREIPVKWAY